MFRALITGLVILGLGVSFVYADGEAVPYPAVTSQPQPERTWGVVHVNNTKAKVIAEVIDRLLKEERVGLPIGPMPIIMADPASNSLLVSATEAEQKKIQGLIKVLDVRPPMVNMELIIIETSKDEPSPTSNADMGSKATSTGFSKAQPLSVEQLKGELGLASPGSFADGSAVISQIKALEKAGRLDVVRRPQISALSGQAAQLTIGRDEPCVTGVAMSKHGEHSSITYRKVGLVMTVTPRVSSDGVITMEIVITESHLGPDHEGVPISKTKERTVWAPCTVSTSAQSVVRLKSGQATVLGGLANSGSTDEPGQLILISATAIRN